MGVENYKFPINISEDIIKNILAEKYMVINKKIHPKPSIGIMNGLYATSLGVGGIISVEAFRTLSDRKLELELTGQQGDVMKESMKVAKTVAWNLIPEDMKKNILSYVDNRVDKNRIIFAERVDRQMHMARICNIDIALDTRVYNGHTTSIEMLQSGVPLVTLEGKHFASRVSTSLLTALGMKDLITKDIDGYKEIVSGLIADSKALGSLKKKLIQKLSESKLMDTNFFARSFEDAILRIFK